MTKEQLAAFAVEYIARQAVTAFAEIDLQQCRTAGGCRNKEVCYSEDPEQTDTIHEAKADCGDVESV